MVKQTKLITIFSFSLLLSGCLNSTVSPRPVVQKNPTTTISIPHRTVSLGVPISTPQEHIEKHTTVTYDLDEDIGVPKEEIYPVFEEEDKSDLPIESGKEESTEEIDLDEPTPPTEVVDNTQSSKTPQPTLNPFGDAPQNYRQTIKSYLSKNANPAYSLKYIFSRPQKAYKNNRSWKGWMVQVDVLKRNGKGEILKNQPYTILFNGSTILEDIKNGNPKNITKVIY